MRRDVKLRVGYCELFKLIAACLKSNILPSSENLLSQVTMNPRQYDYSNEYLKAGGSMSDALGYLFATSFAVAEAYGPVASTELTNAPTTALPRCFNDGAFHRLQTILVPDKSTKS